MLNLIIYFVLRVTVNRLVLLFYFTVCIGRVHGDGGKVKKMNSAHILKDRFFQSLSFLFTTKATYL